MKGHLSLIRGQMSSNTREVFILTMENKKLIIRIKAIWYGISNMHENDLIEQDIVDDMFTNLLDDIREDKGHKS